ncbi:MAG TPA: hypothetical protein VFD92_19525 [Candidatus Binatia bacterium]|nr:hypothetical protein [Candidatus Binatia bacterium]
MARRSTEREQRTRARAAGSRAGRGSAAVTAFAVGAGAAAIVGAALALAAEPLPPLRLFSTPAVVDPRDARELVDRVVVVEMQVDEVKSEPGRLVLVPPPADGDFRVVVVPPLIGEAPRRLAARYRGRRVRVTGKVREFDGEVEILVTDPERVAVVGEEDELAEARPHARPSPVALVPPEPAAPPARPAPEPTLARREPASGARGVVAAAPPPAAAAAPPPLAVPGAPPPPAARAPSTAGSSGQAQCREARHDWKEAAIAARGPLDGLAECLAGGAPPCAADLAAVRSALAELAAHEQRIQWLCGEAR